MDGFTNIKSREDRFDLISFFDAMQLYLYPNIWISKIDIKEIIIIKKGDEYCCYADCQSKTFAKIVRLLKNLFDVLLIDGPGILHPRKCGLASYVGIMIDKPTSKIYYKRRKLVIQ